MSIVKMAGGEGNEAGAVTGERILRFILKDEPLELALPSSQAMMGSGQPAQRGRDCAPTLGRGPGPEDAGEIMAEGQLGGCDGPGSRRVVAFLDSLTGSVP